MTRGALSIADQASDNAYHGLLAMHGEAPAEI